MLTAVFADLFAHLNKLELPVYLSDCVPQGAGLPYITADIQLPLQPGAEGSVTLICWCAGEGCHLQRLSYAGQLADAIPPRGLYLATDAGALIITHHGGMQYVNQQGIMGVSFRCRLKFFPKGKEV